MSDAMRAELIQMLELSDLLDDWAIDDMRPARPVVLPETEEGFWCMRFNAIIYPPVRSAHEQVCGCRPVRSATTD